MAASHPLTDFARARAIMSPQPLVPHDGLRRLLMSISADSPSAEPRRLELSPEPRLLV